MAVYKTHSPEETALLGEQFAARCTRGTFIAFRGGMGAGKTTFCAGLARGLGCIDLAFSPTFAIVNYYRGPLPLAHFDLYRLSCEEDLFTSGFYDYLDEGAVVAVEWSELLAEFLPPPNFLIEFETINDTTRKITVTEMTP